MSTILTINANKSKTRVEFSQPLCSISEIQLVDYDFPETYEEFKTNQTIKSDDGSKTLLLISASSYSFKIMRLMIIMSNLGIHIHSTNEGFCISSKDHDGIVSRDLAKVLDIPNYLFKNKSYPITWPSHKYHVYCDIGTLSSVLGQITSKECKLLPTNLLAVIPSKSGIYPSCQIWSVDHPINYITLLVLDENGKEGSWGGVAFRINLRITY